MASILSYVDIITSAIQAKGVGGIAIKNSVGTTTAVFSNGGTASFYTPLYVEGGVRFIGGGFWEYYYAADAGRMIVGNDGTRTLITSELGDGGGGWMTGVTRFTTPTEVPDEAYGSGWNGKTEIPTKNAIYDIVQPLVTPAFSTKSANYTIVATDDTIKCITNSFTVTLLDATAVPTGEKFTIQNSGVGTITLATTSSQTINGNLTITILQYDSITVQSDGANWIITG